MIIEGENNETELDTENTATDGVGDNQLADTSGSGQRTVPEKDERTLEEKGLEAFNTGTEAVKGKPDDAPIPAPKETKGGDAAGKERPATAKPGAKGDHANAGAADPKAKVKDPDVQKEVDTLGLKGKAAERFHELNDKIKSFDQLNQVLKPLNVDNPKVLDSLLVDAARGLHWEEEIMKSTASPDQLKNALVVVHAINSNDPKLMNIAFEQLSKEVGLLGQKLGRSGGDGSADPLAAHKDLQDAVEKMDMTREYALEIARHRAADKLETERRQNLSRQTEQQNQQTAAQKKEQADSVAALERLDGEYRRTDANYAHKMKTLIDNGTFEEIKQLPWSQREAAVRVAWRNVPDPAPARPRPSHVASRTGGAPAGGALREQKTFKTDLDAFEAGILSVTPGGG